MRWLKNLFIWAVIGTGILFFGGLAAHGYRAMLGTTPAAEIDWLALWYMSIGGGIVLGLIGLALTLASPRGVGWALGVGTVAVLLFLIFVWPTPYKYYRTKGGQLVRVHRLTGTADYVIRGGADARSQGIAPTASASQN
jgi:hypothetical protein